MNIKSFIKGLVFLNSFFIQLREIPEGCKDRIQSRLT